MRRNGLTRLKHVGQRFVMHWSRWIRRYVAKPLAPLHLHGSIPRNFGPSKKPSLTDELDHVRSEITNLEEQQNELEARVKDAGSLKGLLYEQGIPLEHAVLKAMRLIGFEGGLLPRFRLGV